MERLGMRNEDLSVEAAVKEIAGLLATAYQRYIKAMRLAPQPSDDDLDNRPDSSPHVVDARRTRR
jgi:hypothetical protein